MIFGWRKRTDDTLQDIVDMLEYLIERNNELMANWEMIKADIAALKAIAAKEWQVVMDMKAKLADALSKEVLDPADVQAVHDDMASFATDLENKLHADGT